MRRWLRALVLFTLRASLIDARIRAFVRRPNATANFKPLPAERLSVHVERARSNTSGGLWALIDETYRVVTNYNQDYGGSTSEGPLEIDAIVGLLRRRRREEWRTVCEIGMNAGSSALIWLHGTDAQLKEFDLFERAYSLGI